MSTVEGGRPIVVRRKRSHSAHAHGAWKIAYADFMTAMMAFFLVMWLVSGLSQGQLAQVSKYFRTPLKVALVGGNQASASDSPVPGGGDDPTHADGQEHDVDPNASNYTPDRASHHESEAARQQPDQALRDLEDRLHRLIAKKPALSSMDSQINMEMVPDGLLIQIFDNPRRPMFALGSARIAPYVRNLLTSIAPQLNSVSNRINLIGHTDSLPYENNPSEYSNWELSSARANAARRALVSGGMQATKILRVIGAAATREVAGDSPDAAVNRRISIFVLNNSSQARIQSADRMRDRAFLSHMTDQDVLPMSSFMQPISRLPDKHAKKLTDRRLPLIRLKLAT